MWGCIWFHTYRSPVLWVLEVQEVMVGYKAKSLPLWLLLKTSDGVHLEQLMLALIMCIINLVQFTSETQTLFFSFNCNEYELLNRHGSFSVVLPKFLGSGPDFFEMKGFHIAVVATGRNVKCCGAAACI